MSQPTLKYEFRCGAPNGKSSSCNKLLGTAQTGAGGFLEFDGGWLYPTDDIKDILRFNCPKHGVGEIEPRSLGRRPPQDKAYRVMVFRD